LKGLKVLLGVIFVIFLTYRTQGQVVTQTYIDPCDLKTYIVTIPIQSNTGVLVIIRGDSKTFTYTEFNNGVVDRWVNSIFSKPCPTSLVVQQTVTTTVTQASSTAASTAASSAASSSTSSSTSSSVSSSSGGGSESSEGGGSESKSESENGENKSDEKKDEKKEDKKKSEEKKKMVSTNPMLVASDLTSTQGPDLKYSVIASFGISKASMAGNESWSLNAMIWSTLKQFAVSGGYTKMDFNMGKLESIHSYSITAAYLDGNYMNLIGYTNIRPNPKYGTYGYNVGVITLLLKDQKMLFE
jgi:hypothetical protein